MAHRAEHLYRRLLLILPRSFRLEAEAELLETFRSAHAQVASRGLIVRIRFWALMFADVLVTSLAERRLALRPAAAPSVRSLLMRLADAVLSTLSDIRLAARRYANTPGWTLMLAGTLGLGLAASVVAVVLVRDVLWKPLPFAEPDRLVRVREVSENGRRWWPSVPNALDWREHGGPFQGVAIADIAAMAPVLLDGRAVRVPVSRAARGLFETLGVRPLIGRLFSADESRPGGEPVALVSEGFWRRELRGRPLDGSTITIGTTPFTIVGVVPATFRFLGDGGAWTEPADVWTSLDRDPPGHRTSHGVHVVGRLRDGLSLADARVEMNQLVAALKSRHKEGTNADGAQLTLLSELVTGRAREPLQLLLYASAAVLLVSCLNLAAAILAQGFSRGRELAVRLALGATRVTLVRHLLTEAGTLSLPGAAVGLALAATAFQVIRASSGGTLPRLDEVAMDRGAVAVGIGLAGLTALVAGLIPAVVLSRRAQADHLRTHGSTTGPREQRLLWTGLVSAQVALTVGLLIGTGLLVRSFQEALRVDLGYDPRGVLAVDVALPELRYAEPGRQVAFYEAVLERLRATAGVQAAGLTSVLPHNTSMHTAGSSEPGRPARVVMGAFRLVDHGYFDAMAIPRLQGSARALGDGAVVDRRLQEVLWTDGDAIGRQVRNGFSDKPLTVAGVVGTVRQWHEGEETTGTIYTDFRRRPDRLRAMHFVVRARPLAMDAVPIIRQAIASVDPLVPVTIEPLEARTAESLAGRRLMLLLASGFGIIALLLAGAGVYAMVAFAVGRQMREAAIRLALGASPASLRRRVVLHGIVPVAVGLAAGGALGVPMGRALRGQLFQVQPSDPAVFLATAAVVILAAILACWPPAIRATRIDPAAALRQD